MRIRNKFLGAMMLAVALLAIQVAAVSYFIRELQSAVSFISSAQSAIEADFVAAELVAQARQEIKRLPSSYVSEPDPAQREATSRIRSELSSRIEFVRSSDAVRRIDSSLRDQLVRASATAQKEWTQTLDLASSRADLDRLIDRAIITDRALVNLAASLDAFAIELRRQLQAAVERERELHNRPLIAGIAIGGLAILLLLAFTWIYVDRQLVSRLSALGRSMLDIAGGDLRAPLPPRTGNDEIAQMVDALAVFRDTAVEVEELNLRERQVVLDTINYGVLILDPNLCVRMHNRGFRELAGLSAEALGAKAHLRDIILSSQIRGILGVVDDERDKYVEKRLTDVREANMPPQEWHLPDGRTLQYEVVALPDGGRMLTYFDLTHLKEVETQLRAAKEEAELRSHELTRSLNELRATQDRLIQTEKLASLGQLTAGIAHEIKNPLNFVNNFSALSSELVDELRQVLKRAPLDEQVREEVAELTGMLTGNLEKVVQHGRRADSIVKNMLLHSREGLGEHLPSDINAIVEESVNLAYHGARAEAKGFNITLEKSLDPTAGEVDVFPQEMTRVLLNLISNGFYATAKRKAQADGAYEPTLVASTKNLGDRVEIRIRDNGIGIPPEVKAKIFNPFFTTKPAGEGTGLGLSLSHDIVVKQHAGTIEVDTAPGEFTEFRIVLPRGAAALAASGGRA